MHLSHSDNQRRLLENALAVANRVPAAAPANGGPAVEETAWKNCWNWCVTFSLFRSLSNSHSCRSGTFPTLRSEVLYSTFATDVWAAR